MAALDGSDVPPEVDFRRRARSLGMAPWELERALEEDPRALRWYLLEPDLAAYESAREANR